jgi:hypothetical protein
MKESRNEHSLSVFWSSQDLATLRIEKAAVNVEIAPLTILEHMLNAVLSSLMES